MAVNTALPAGGTVTPQFLWVAPFLNTALSTAVTGTGAVTDTGAGCRLNTGATGNSLARMNANVPAFPTWVFDGNSQFSFCNIQGTEGTDYQFFCGVGNLADSGTNLVTTVRQYGFKIIRASSVSTYSATCANGTTETATSFTPNDDTAAEEWAAVKSGTTNIKYYENRTLRATHTTNMPASTGAGNLFHAVLNNANVASNSTRTVRNYVFSQDVV